MNLSPQDRQDVLEMVATKIAREVLLGGGQTMAELVLLPMTVVQKMLSLDAHTIKTRMAWVEIASNRTAVRLSEVKAYLEASSREPREPGKKGRAA
jgi:hypothetical protein